MAQAPVDLYVNMLYFLELSGSPETAALPAVLSVTLAAALSAVGSEASVGSAGCRWS